VTSRNLARASLVVTAAFLASRILGWVRLIVIGNVFGARADLDAYFAAFRIPDLIYQLAAAGALASALIPVLAGLLHNGEDARAWRVTSSVINIMLIALVVFSLTMAVFAPVIVPFLVPGFDVVNTELTIRLTRIMLLSPILLALGAVASSVLNTQGRFGAAAVAPLLYNGLIIVCALALSPFMGIDALAVGVVLGSFAHFAVQLPSLRNRFHYDLSLDLRDSATRQALLLMAPRAIGLGVNQVTFVVNTTLATGLGVGAVVAYNIAFNVLQIPIGVIGVPLGVVLLPSMSRAIAAGQVREFGSLVQQSLRLLLYVTIWITAVGIVLRRETVELLFGGGFDEQALALTSNALLFFLLGLPANCLNVVLARAFYSGRDTRTPVAVAVLSVVVNVVVSVVTVGSMGLAGLALGIALGGWTDTLILSAILWRRTHAIDIGSIVSGTLVFTAGSVLSALGALATIRLVEEMVGDSPGRFVLAIEMAAAAAVAGAIYLLYCRLMRIPEMTRVLGLIRSALPHRSAPDRSE
jgi:putative peptidoglycan lipid II flippase